MKNKGAYFKLFANCIPVKGLKRSTIIDLQKGGIQFIPNELYDILDLCNQHISVQLIKEKFNHEFNNGIDAYFNEFEKNDIGFYTDYPDNFPALDEKWDFPGLINNCIIDFNKKSQHPMSKIIQQLDNLGCEFVQLRFFDSITTDNLKIILDNFNKSGIRSIQLIKPYIDNSCIESAIQIYMMQRRIESITIINAPENKNHQNDYINLITSTQKIQNSSFCGYISQHDFSSNILHYTEAKKWNTCLNKKISIDVDGSIKNCPSFRANFGNIKNQSLIKIAAESAFQKLWHIKKDDIDKCKSCEFRYVCSDCRAYLEEPTNEYSKPLKCGYDPEKCEWEEWSTNPLKMKSIQQYAIKS